MIIFHECFVAFLVYFFFCMILYRFAASVAHLGTSERLKRG